MINFFKKCVFIRLLFLFQEEYLLLDILVLKPNLVLASLQINWKNIVIYTTVLVMIVKQLLEVFNMNGKMEIYRLCQVKFDSQFKRFTNKSAYWSKKSELKLDLNLN